METWDFDFKQEDVFANQQGVLSARQETFVDTIYQARQRGARQTLLAFMVFLPALVIFGVIIEYRNQQDTLINFLNDTGWIWVMMIGLFSLMLMISAASSVYVSRNARNRRISIAEGTASVYVGEMQRYGRNYPRYELTLKRGMFRSRIFRFTSESVVRRFEAGKHYRVYYIKFYPLPIILSAEELQFL